MKVELTIKAMTKPVNGRIDPSSSNGTNYYYQHELAEPTEVACRLNTHSRHDLLVSVILMKQGAPSLVAAVVEAMPLPGVVVRGPSRVGLSKTALMVTLPESPL